MRTAVYARISRDPEEQREGVDRQIERATKIAAERGWQVVDTFADNDLSGFKTTRRPGFEALRDRIVSDGIEAVLVQHQDRLARNVQTFRNFADLCRDHDVRLETWSGPIEINSATGRFTSTVQSAVDEHYSALISEKVRVVVDERARLGQPNGGRRAFGYLAGDPTRSRTHNFEIDPDEADVVRELYARVLAGESIRAIRIDLNARQILTTAGNPFNNRGVRELLINPRYIAMRTHRGNVIGEAAWEPIIDRETFERAQAILGDPRRRDYTGGPRTYYLSGLAYCGTCGHRLVARPQWRPNLNVRSYGCPARAEGGCGGSRIIAQPLEDFIRDVQSWKFDWLDVPAFFRAAEVVLEYPMVDKDPLPAWSFGRVTLLGDAAHPMVPRGSNGAGQAILDARALADCLQKHSDRTAALKDYETQRLQPTSSVVLENRRNPPDAVLREVYERTGDRPFRSIDEVISVAELKALTDRYKRVAGYDQAALRQ